MLLVANDLNPSPTNLTTNATWAAEMLALYKLSHQGRSYSLETITLQGMRCSSGISS